jgi:hypothetical protein
LKPGNKNCREEWDAHVYACKIITSQLNVKGNWRGFFLLGLHKGKWKGRWIGDVISVSQKIISEEDRFIGFWKAQILESVACFFSV